MPGILSPRKITVKGAPAGRVATAMAQAPPLTVIFRGKTAAPIGWTDQRGSLAATFQRKLGDQPCSTICYPCTSRSSHESGRVGSHDRP